MSIRVLVKAPLNPYSGYGTDGLGIVRSLIYAGCDVYLDPTHVSPPLPGEVAELLTKRLEAPFDLLIHHVDPGQLGITPEALRSSDITVGWTMWEYSTLDNLKQRRGLKKKLSSYDVVFGYDTVSATALRPYLKADQSEVLQGGFWPEDWPYLERDWHSPRFGFCMVGQLHQRKDPFVAIQAFQELKDEHPEEFEPAELHLKSNTPGLHSKLSEMIPKLRIHYATWPEEVLRQFYAAQHVLLAPSRGEGKNLPALEFMSTGGTVIATNWGGHSQWLSTSYAYPLHFTLAPVDPATPDCLNARASKEHLKTLMLQAFRSRDEAKRKGSTAAKVIPGMCSWDAVIDRLFDKLARSVPGRGEQLLHRFRKTAEVARAAYGRG